MGEVMYEVGNCRVVGREMAGHHGPEAEDYLVLLHTEATAQSYKSFRK